eukprot:Gb_29836 [translate_table: standard]
MAPPTGRRKRKLKREELAVLLSVVGTAVVIVQRFLTDNDLLLLPSQTMALEASVQATTLAISKLQMMFSLAQVVSIVEKEKDRVGPNDRDIANSWFDRFTSAVTDDKTWRENFRMTKTTFDRLLESLHPALQRQDTAMKDAIPAHFKLGAALFRLAHGATFKSVARKFGIGTRSACKAFYEVCKALEDQLGYLFEFPSSMEGLHSIIDSFASLGMPNCCGVIGCTRFLVEKPVIGSSSSTTVVDYSDPQGQHSVVMQGLVDFSGRFLDISVGWPGSLTPAMILLRTHLFSRVEESGELLQGPPADLINGVLMPQYIVGDKSCPLLPWLLTPYAKETHATLTPAQELFNNVHEYARSAVSRAFGMLKSQWQLLTMRQRVNNIERLPFIVAAACVLQNFLIKSGEPMPNVQEYSEKEFPEVHERNEYAESIRDALASHISMVAQMRAQL